jgi:TPR repeat protein
VNRAKDLEIEVNFRYPENINREWSIEPDASRLLFAIELAKSNPSECLKIWHELAQQGSNLAKCYLGDAYANGRGVDHDIERGMEWYQRAADSGSTEASHRLAFWLWYQGEYPVSVERLKAIGERGFSPALCVLGSIYYSDYDDHTIYGNVELAIKYWKDAEILGNLIAKRRLSIFLRRKDSTAFDKFRGYLKLLRLLPEFMYFSIKHPKSDRLRGWTHGAGITVPVY